VERVRNWHLAFFPSLAEQAEPELYRAEQQEWLDRLDLEQDNLRAALERAMQTSGESALRLVGALSRFWWVRSRFDEGRRWLGAALARTSGSSTARAKALHNAGLLRIPGRLWPWCGFVA
jgi:predicted ATPase